MYHDIAFWERVVKDTQFRTVVHQGEADAFLISFNLISFLPNPNPFSLHKSSSSCILPQLESELTPTPSSPRAPEDHVPPRPDSVRQRTVHRRFHQEREIQLGKDRQVVEGEAGEVGGVSGELHSQWRNHPDPARVRANSGWRRFHAEGIASVASHSSGQFAVSWDGEDVITRVTWVTWITWVAWVAVSPIPRTMLPCYRGSL